MAVNGVGDEDRLMAAQRFGQRAWIIVGQVILLSPEVLIRPRQQPTCVIPEVEQDGVVAVTGADQLGKSSQELITIQQPTQLLIDPQTRFELSQALMGLPPIVTDQSAWEAGDSRQLPGRDCIDVFRRNEDGIVVQMGRIWLFLGGAKGGIHGLSGDVEGRGLDRGRHASVQDCRQRQRIAIDADDQGARIDQPDLAPRIPGRECQRIGQAKYGIEPLTRGPLSSLNLLKPALVRP